METVRIIMIISNAPDMFLCTDRELPVSSENHVVGSCQCRQGDDVWLVLLKRNTLAAFNIHNT